MVKSIALKSTEQKYKISYFKILKIGIKIAPVKCSTHSEYNTSFSDKKNSVRKGVDC